MGNAGHTVKRVWTDMSVTSARYRFIHELSTGLKNPSGKGKRLTVLHIRSEDGFVENGSLIFESRKTGDYHEEMNSTVFEEWFKRVLPTLEENSAIVMDNASYHSRKIEKMLQEKMRLENIDLNLRRQMWFQHDGAPPHNSRLTQQVLNTWNPHKWIGRGDPVAWPPSSVGFTTRHHRQLPRGARRKGAPGEKGRSADRA
jgi:hypothetical protein